MAVDDPIKKTLATADLATLAGENPLTRLATVEDPIQKLMRQQAEDPMRKWMAQETAIQKAISAAQDPLVKWGLNDPIRKMLEDDDRIRQLVSGADRFSHALRDPGIQSAIQQAQEISRMMEDSGVLRFAREAQRHADMIRAVSDSKWITGITSMAEEARLQMTAFSQSGAFRVIQQASEVSRQFEATGIAKMMTGLNIDRWVTTGAGELARAIGAMAAQPHLAALMGGRPAHAEFYRDMGFDFVQMAGASAVSANAHFDEAAASLKTIEEALNSGQADYDAVTVTRGFRDIVHALAVAIDSEQSSVERRALLKVLQFLIPILVSLWIWHAQHLETLENQKASDKVAAIAHQDALATQHAIEHLGQRIAQEQGQTADETFYGVIRLVPLCEGPKYHGPHKFVLLPGAEVELVRKHHKWLEVCAVAPAGGTAQGWILKKYLRRIGK